MSLKMAKGTTGRRRIVLRQSRATPYLLRSRNHGLSECTDPKKCSRHSGKDWEDVTCSVCMEYPHNAVLLLCSSHDKGCRPYMCGTSFRYSNCLDRYKKACTKVTQAHNTHPSYGPVVNSEMGPVSDLPVEKCELAELACPLCRGEVKGWTVVEPVRKYLNAKMRSCMQDKCSFAGTFKELRKHVKLEHPCSRPREVDSVIEQKWRNIVQERERDDVISTIRSSMPGAMVLGDYVIEGSHHSFDNDAEDDFIVDAGESNNGFDDSNLANVFLFLHASGLRESGAQNRRVRGHGRELDGISDGNTAEFRHSSSSGFGFPDQEIDSHYDGSDGGENDGTSPVHRTRRRCRVLLRRSGRRRRHREATAADRE